MNDAVDVGHRDAPLFVVLMALRSVPALLRRRRPAPGRPMLDEFLRAARETRF